MKAFSVKTAENTLLVHLLLKLVSCREGKWSIAISVRDENIAAKTKKHQQKKQHKTTTTTTPPKNNNKKHPFICYVEVLLKCSRSLAQS